MESVWEGENAKPEEAGADDMAGDAIQGSEAFEEVVRDESSERSVSGVECGSASEQFGNLETSKTDLLPEQWASVNRAAPKDRAGFEAYYREENQRVAEQEREESEKAERLDGLKRELCSLQAATEWVMRGCGFEDDGRKRGVWRAICDVLQSRAARGRPLWDAAPAMVDAWLDYQRIGAMLAVQYGAVKFFRLGVWQKRSGWRIDAKKAEMQGASVGS
jgi:hypothetical protein